MSFPLLIRISVLLVALAAVHCRGIGEGDSSLPWRKKETAALPEKLRLPGTIPPGADPLARVTECTGPLRLEELRRQSAESAGDRVGVEVSVSGSFQELADFLACLAKGEVKWQVGPLTIRRGPPKFFDFRMTLQLTAFHFLAVPAPDLPDRAAAQKRLENFSTRLEQALRLLSALYLVTEPAVELREIALAEGQGSFSGRAESYAEIEALLAELKEQGAVQNPRLESIRLNRSRQVEKKQEFEIRFDW